MDVALQLASKSPSSFFVLFCNTTFELLCSRQMLFSVLVAAALLTAFKLLQVPLASKLVWSWPASLIRSTLTLDSFVSLPKIDGHSTSVQSFHVLIKAFRSAIENRQPESVSGVNPFLWRGKEGWGTNCTVQMYKADKMWQTQTHGCNYRKRKLHEGDLKGLNKDSAVLRYITIIRHTGTRL